MNEQNGSMNAEDELIEVVTFEDDEGNSFSMEIVEEFEHNGVKYAVLADFAEEEHEHDCDCGEETCDCDQNLYIFEVVKNDDGEEDFVAIEDDDLLETLSAIVEERLMISEEE